jgi:Flp pilus assembly protein TadD
LGGIWGRDSTSVASSKPPAAVSPSESVSKVFRQVNTSITGAFDFQPEKIPANDPTRLSDRPGKLSPRVYVRAAAWAEDQDAPHIAQAQYEKALELDPDNAHALVAFARFQDRQGNGDEALQLYKRALAAAPESQVVLNDMGIFYARRRELDSSLDFLSKAVQLAPDNVRYRNNLAGVLVMSGRPEDAVVVLQTIHPNAVAHMNVGHFLYMEKDVRGAASYFQQASQLDPSLVAARELLRRIGLSEAQQARKAPDPPPSADPEMTPPVASETSFSGPVRLSSVPQVTVDETPSDDSETVSTDGESSETETPSDGPRRLPAVD